MGFSLDIATSTTAENASTTVVTEENSAEVDLDLVAVVANKDDDEDREEGEIIEDTPVEYEDISSDEEVNLRQRIQELEARNIELEKIASISSTKSMDYGLGHTKQTIINLVDDDDDDIPTAMNGARGYSYRKQRRKSIRLSKSSRRDRSSIKHEVKHRRCRRHRTVKQPSKKPSSSRSSNRIKSIIIDNGLSSDGEEELLLDREKLRAALRRETPTAARSTTSSLRNKLKAVKKTVVDAIDNKLAADDDDEELKANKEIHELLESIGNTSDPNDKYSDKETDIEEEQISLEEQELRLIALKSAIVKKHEARKKRKVIESRPYSPTDIDITMEQFESKLLKQQLSANEQPEICAISPPADSPVSLDRSLLPVDMDIVCSETSQSPIFFNETAQPHLPGNGRWIPITDIPLPMDRLHGGEMMLFEPKSLESNMMMAATSTDIEPPKSPEDVEMLDTNYLPDNVVPAISISMADGPVMNAAKEVNDTDSHIDDEEEIALRALLIANLGSPKNFKRKQRTTESLLVPPKTETPPNRLTAHLTSGIDAIKSNACCPPAAAAIVMPFVPSTAVLQKENREINIPHITVNLKEAVKRIKTKYNSQAKTANSIQHKAVQRNRTESKNSNLIVIDLIKGSVANHTVANAQAFKPHRTIHNKVEYSRVEIPVTAVRNTAVTPIDEPPGKAVKVATPTKSLVPKIPFVAKENNIIVKPKAVTAVSTKKPISAAISKTVIGTAKRQAPAAKPAVAAKKTKLLSRMITSNQAKPVNKLVIQLQNSDTESDLEEAFNDSAPSTITEADRLFDNASPSSIAMDSPSCGPCSPVAPNMLANETTDAVTNPAFEQKLDEFLKKVRTNQEHRNEVVNVTAAKTKIALKVSAVADSPRVGNVPVTPLAVRHLPASAQLEYRTLINRMRNLEKQKTIKQQSPLTTNFNANQNQHPQQPSPSHPLIPFTVTIPNNQRKTITSIPDRNTGPTGELKITLKNTGDRLIQTSSATSTHNNVTHVKPDSLMKKVLVKNVSLKVQKQRHAQDMPAKSISSPPTLKVIIPTPQNSQIAIKQSSKTDDIAQKPKPKKIIVDKSSVKLPNEVVQKLPPMPDLSQMSEGEKRKALTAAEKNYTEHSSKFMNEIENMHTLVCSARVAKQKQFDLEIELDTLKLQMQRIEHELSSQKSTISKLYPNISTSHKTVLSNRQKSIQLSGYCMKIGKSIAGDEYKIPDDNKVAIGGKLKVIAMDTKLLKTMKKATSNTLNACATKTEDPTEDENSLTPETTTKCIEAIDSGGQPANNEDTAIKLLSKVSTIEDSSETLLNDNGSIGQATHDSSRDDSAKIETEATTLNADFDDTTPIGKYRSPLNHMQNDSGQNPDAILCPFQLLGQCEDKECSYQHLKS